MEKILFLEFYEDTTLEEIYKEFQKKIVTMSSYKCIAEVEVAGNKSPHNYVFIHNYTKIILFCFSNSLLFYS